MLYIFYTFVLLLQTLFSNMGCLLKYTNAK